MQKSFLTMITKFFPIIYIKKKNILFVLEVLNLESEEFFMNFLIEFENKINHEINIEDTNMNNLSIIN